MRPSSDATNRINDMKALFLGYGNMGKALGEAWLRTKLVASVTAVDPALPRGTQAIVFATIADVDTGPFDLIVLAVKPAMARDAIASLPLTWLDAATVISVAAGVTCDALDDGGRGQIALVRAMPNTPVTSGVGCTGIFANDYVGADQRELIQRLFQAVGKAVWLDEEGQIDVVTALSGSGPAYYHLFSEALVDAGVALGLSPELSKELVVATALGAAALQNEPGASLPSLRHSVTSPNGTTEAAIRRFEEDHKLRTLVSDAAQAACRRAQELARQK
jgi:pyrroline-5-carboxylate reductase